MKISRFAVDWNGLAWIRRVIQCTRGICWSTVDTTVVTKMAIFFSALAAYFEEGINCEVSKIPRNQCILTLHSLRRSNAITRSFGGIMRDSTSVFDQLLVFQPAAAQRSGVDRFVTWTVAVAWRRFQNIRLTISIKIKTTF